MERMTNTLALSDPPGTTYAEAHGGEDLPPPPAKGVWGEGPRAFHRKAGNGSNLRQKDLEGCAGISAPRGAVRVLSL